MGEQRFGVAFPLPSQEIDVLWILSWIRVTYADCFLPFLFCRNCGPQGVGIEAVCDSQQVSQSSSSPNLILHALQKVIAKAFMLHVPSLRLGDEISRCIHSLPVACLH